MLLMGATDKPIFFTNEELEKLGYKNIQTHTQNLKKHI